MKGKIAFVFPGQGAQAVGMGKDLFEANQAAKHVFERADRVIGGGLVELIFNGPEEMLKRTYHTQPALLTVSTAFLEAFRESGISPDYVAGHSLGEYSALVAAGAIEFEDALRTVRSRGQFMEEAVPDGQGAMAAVLGAEREALAELCRIVTKEAGTVEMANINCPGQIVVSGSKEGVQAVVDRGKEAGAKRVIPLEVSGPFHSSLMNPAAGRMLKVISGLQVKRPAVPVIANVTAKPCEDTDEIKQLLVEQVVSPVLWEDSVQWLLGQGVRTFIELGSGTVLAGLIKKIDRTVEVVSINSLDSLEKFHADIGA